MTSAENRPGPAKVSDSSAVRRGVPYRSLAGLAGNPEAGRLQVALQAHPPVPLHVSDRSRMTRFRTDPAPPVLLAFAGHAPERSLDVAVFALELDAQHDCSWVQPVETLFIDC